MAEHKSNNFSLKTVYINRHSLRKFKKDQSKTCSKILEYKHYTIGYVKMMLT